MARGNQRDLAREKGVKRNEEILKAKARCVFNNISLSFLIYFCFD